MIITDISENLLERIKQLEWREYCISREQEMLLKKVATIVRGLENIIEELNEREE